MGGGLMQLVAYGAQDIYLTGNPQITFFKVVYRRHTNFAMEAIVQTFEGQPAANRKVSATIARNGDLVHRVYLECDGAVTASGLVEEVELEIGGQLIDRHCGKWMEIWVELTHDSAKKAQYEDMTEGTDKSWMPLQFSFCRNPGLAIPLIALQYHEVKLNIRFGDTVPGTVCLYCDYIYLDTDERRRFAQTSHEYLIEQTQSSKSNAVAAGCANKVPLHFNHPVKELVWCFNNNVGGVAAAKVLLRLNGHERFSARCGAYFSRVQRYQHHTGAKGSKLSTADTNDSWGDELQMYSFALQPEEHQPSGTCNFSRIDNAMLEVSDLAADADTNTSACVDVYAMNYNVLRIMSGMGGLAYSN